MEKLKNEVRSGIDPEMLAIGAELAAFHIEAGARRFADFVAAIANDLNTTPEKLRRYLRAWYNGARDLMEDAGIDVAGMDDPDTVRAELARIGQPASTSDPERDTMPETETEGGDARDQIRSDGQGPLEKVVPEKVQAPEEGGDAGSRGADGGQPGGTTDRQPDGSGRLRVGGRGNRSSGRNPVPAGKRRKRIEAEPPAPDPADPESEDARTAKVAIPAINFTITEDLRLGVGTESEKFADNVAAIRTLKQIEAENRRATPSEQAVLARYVGWGGLANAFRKAGAADGDGIARGWEKRVAELENLLDPDELKAARNSTKAAHYTSETVVRAIWRAVGRLGFTGGSVLEPSVGSGNFLGLMPQGLRGTSKVLAVEYDSITARIAQHLYPQSTVLHSGFEKLPLPSNTFALAIGNPPFGRDQLHFPYRNEVNGRSIHNQFFLASMHAVAPDGLLAMVVSHHLMDAQDASSRLDLAAMGDLVAGIRLPGNAFLENARTEVVTDILIFRKHSAEKAVLAGMAVKVLSRKMAMPLTPIDLSLMRQSMRASNEDWEKVKSMVETMERWVPSRRVKNFAGSGATISVNPYFLGRGNGSVIGVMDASGTMNGPEPQLNVRLDNPAEIGERLAAIIDAIPQAEPRDTIAERTGAAYESMVQAMKLAAEKAEPGRIRIAQDNTLKIVVDADTDGETRTFLVEMDLTPDTPFTSDYTFNATLQKWTSVEDVLDKNGKPVKVRKADGTLSTRNRKKVVVHDDLKRIPATRRWGEKRIAKLREIIRIKNLMKRQLALETQGAPDSRIEENRKKLNDAYDAYVAAHGVMHSRETSAIANVMPDGALALATERMEKSGPVKAAIMSARVALPPQAIETASSPAEAVAISLSERGVIDPNRIAQLLKTDEAGAIAAISQGDSPLAFYDPQLERWESADMYLQGLVSQKLKAASAAGLTANVKALEQVMPEPVQSVDITPTMGANWIPAKVYAAFLAYLGYQSPAVSYSLATNTYSVMAHGDPAPAWQSPPGVMSAVDIVEKTLNSMPIKVMQTDVDGKEYVDEVATADSQIRAAELAAEFEDWAFRDEDRREQLTSIFNEKFNGRVNRQRNGSHLRLPGKSEAVTLRTHQVNAIWRGITDARVLYDHAVGAGKTFVAIARIMERRRMGLSRKPLVVVPNHIIGQWVQDVRKLYPSANILAAEPSDFKGPERRRLFARIAAGDYDMVIIGHSSFGFIDIDPATEQRFLEAELREAMRALKEAEADSPSGRFKSLGVKQAEQLVTRLQTRLDRIMERRRDRLLTFEEMGIDDLTVDESHEFKNLSYASRLTGVAGMGNKAGSKKAIDLHLKVRSLLERSGTSVAFLTGTPVSNSVAELYLVLRNLAMKELKELGLENFDAWRTMFVSATAAFEPTESGGIKEVTRLGRNWNNMRALMDLYYSVADAVSLDDVKRMFEEEHPGESFPVPPVRSQKTQGKDRELVVVDPTPAQRRILREIVAGFDELPDIADPNTRNAERLRLMDRARKVSLDARAVDPEIEVAPGTGKIGAVVDNIVRIYARWNADKGTQVVFLDRSVPKAKGDEEVVAKYDALIARLKKAQDEADEREAAAVVEELDKYDEQDIAARRAAIMGGWNAYDEIKNQLVARGIPAEEIVFVQSAKNDDEKRKMFAMVNAGEVRVIIGSTPRMGAGTNIQDRLVALHHVDVTWKPSDIEQREGRIIRQGNVLLEKYGHDGFEVEVLAYATRMTIDSKMWALNADKLKAINGLRKYDGAFGMEVEDEESASMAEIAALATGNPLMVERVTLYSDLNKLDLARRSFNNRMNGLRAEVAKMERIIATTPDSLQRIGEYRDIMAPALDAVRERSAQRSVTVNGTVYRDSAEASAAAAAAIAEQRKDNENARFKVDIDGRTLTVQDDISTAIREAFGHPDFEAEIDGTAYISHYRAGEALARKMNGAFRARTGNDQTVLVDGIKLNGLPLEIDIVIEPDNLLGGEPSATFSLVHRGVAMFVEKLESNTANGFTAQAVAARLQSLARRATLDTLQRRKENLEASVARAEATLPGLREELTKTWPKEEEFEQKKARYFEVVKLLENATDATRLQDDPPADGMMPEDDGEIAIQEARGAASDAPITPAALRRIAAALDAEMRRSGLSGKVPMAVVREVTAPAAAGRDRRPSSMGRFGRQGIQVRAGAEAGEIGVLRHEIIHALRNARLWSRPYGLFTQAEWQALVKAARADKALMTNIRDRYPDLGEEKQIEEAIAEAYRMWGDRKDDSGVLKRAVEKIRAFFRALVSALRGEGFADAAMVMERIASGKVGRRSGQYDDSRTDIVEQEMRPGFPDLRADKDAPTGKRRWRWSARAFWSDLLTDAMSGRSDQRYSILALVPGRALLTELAGDMKAARAYLRTKEEMDALRNAWHMRADAVAQSWRKLRNSNKAANQAMMDLMHESTMDQVDPSMPDNWRHPFQQPAERAISEMGDDAPDWAHEVMGQIARHKETYARLKAGFDALPPEFQAMFRKVRDEHAALANAHEQAIIENVKKSIDVAVKRAERTYRKEMQRIRDEGLEGEEREIAEAAAREKRDSVVLAGGWAAKARMAILRQAFERNRLRGPYFPLARFGDLFLTVRDADGAVVEFYRFETAAEQRAAREQVTRELLQELEGRTEEEKARAVNARIQAGALSETGSLREMVDPRFAAEIVGILGDADVDQNVMDAIWQHWLETLPDRSMRKNRIHRKNRRGFSTDAFRAFGKAMFHGAHQLAKLKYGIDLGEHLADAEEEAALQPDKTRAMLVVNEIRKRHDFVMNPTASALVQAASGLSFIWYLGLSPAAAIVNVTQTTVVGVPMMAAHFGFRKTAGVVKELGKAAADFARGRGGVVRRVGGVPVWTEQWSAGNASTLTDDEKAAIAEAYRRGTLDKTQGHDLAGVQETGIEYNATRERVMRAIGFLFHHTERFNREVTFLASYRLARRNGESHQQAVQTAADLTWAIHYDYQSSSKPRIMQGADLRNILFIFKNFTVNMLWRLFRDAHQMFSGATPEARREARTQLIGISLSMMAHAGIRGVWGYGLLMTLLGMLGGGADDADEWLQDALLMEGDSPGVTAWNWIMTAALNGIPGTVTGTDLTNRIGMPDLWFRGPDRDMEGVDALSAYVTELLGPALGIVTGGVRGLDLVQDGEWWRGVETAVPKPVRDAMKAVRFAAEGATTLNDDPIIEDFTPLQLLAQVNGFTPAELADRYRINNHLKNQEKRIMDERRRIEHEIGDAIMAGEPVPARALEAMRAFNREYPEYPITRDSLKQSMRARRQASGRNEFGVALNPKLNARLRERLAPSVYANWT
jgi:N12 class adenine-specific DNA methylase